MGKSIQTGIRISSELETQVAVVANKYGLSKNGASIMLMVLGLKVLENINVNLPDECLHEVLHNQQ